MKKSKLADFDPESLLDPAPSSSDDENSDFSDAEETNAGREHYSDVSKSRLRKKEVVPLGPQYTGSRISRHAVEDEDSDDPFARGFDDEGDSEEDESEEDDTNAVAVANGSVDEDSVDGDEHDDADSDDEMEELDGGEDGFDEDDEDEDEAGNIEEDADERSAKNSATLRAAIQVPEPLVATLAQAAHADVAKGQAVKAQRRTFNTLLNTRVRLQKALISTNSMAAAEYNEATAPDVSIQAAEQAALALLNNLTEMRASLDSSLTGTKRKRTLFEANTPSSEIWTSLGTDTTAHRAAVLEKWSGKTSVARLKAGKGRLNAEAQQTLTDVLAAQVQDSSHLISRTQTPRSCAPLQAAANAGSSSSIYDDADFYGLLLKELLEQRNAELAGNGPAEFVVQAPWQAVREAKTKKVVDTKASKGRRLRYTVHEKLQNFVAPEERGTWGERQREELFSSLFGKKITLGEADDVDSEPEEVDAEEEGLMLFRS
ncbi:apoptosis-antagonizing transcription factor [Massariosphaeria phaeospora]|uniref:Protein BFR2 n=1 Tax=Massariosphaeria phaeospora TaxID=100035 RepID=A0A7C8M8A0_9PLEO|nr:apoptosis-antagonizing transcription factor [Massariosphaeria phaeospora]